MASQRPGVLAVRAVNQYRQRDVMTYLGLRYYLENTAARTDFWAKDVAVDLVIHRAKPVYLNVSQFKEIDERGSITYRNMHLPGPNEALAEAALVQECALRRGAFELSKDVYSYRPAVDDDRSGIFTRYMDGLRARHEAIAQACRLQSDAVVRYCDIKKFYPSISSSLAARCWESACAESKVDRNFQLLGQKLLDDYAGVNKSEGILTGPMFSHLIANLVLRTIDQDLPLRGAKYFRYVDDVAFVGSKAQVHESITALRGKLGELGLQLHDDSSPKSLEVSAKDWLVGEDDFTDSKSGLSWKTLIGDLKKFLLWYPEQTEELSHSLSKDSFRVPVNSYAEAIRDATFVERVGRQIRKQWFLRTVREINIAHIKAQAQALRRQYEGELAELLRDFRGASPFMAKRLLPKIRYRLGRLSYLSTPTVLKELSSQCTSIPQLKFQAEVAFAVATGNLDALISFGSHAAQAVAQPLRMASYPTALSRRPESNSEWEAYSVFAFNGISLQEAASADDANDLSQLARVGPTRALMSSENLFVQELACLHGISDTPRHREILSTAFDEAEEIALDAIDQARLSMSF